MGTEQLIHQAVPKMVAQMRQAMPQVPEDVWRQFQKPETAKELMQLYIPIYERHFTHTEIKGLLEFYDTPLGKRLLSSMPMVLQESMDAGTKWGVDLAKRVAEQPSKQSSDSSTAKTPPKASPLTSYQKEWIVKQMGYDTSRYTVDDSGETLIPKPEPTKPPDPTPPATLPEEVHYFIQFTDPSGVHNTYFSRTEPKPFGGGYKFKIYPTDTEITVSGNVQIMKIQ